MNKTIGILLLLMACSKSGGGADKKEGRVDGSLTIAGKAIAVNGCTAERSLGEVAVHFQLADGRLLTYAGDDLSIAADDMSPKSGLSCESGKTTAIQSGSNTDGAAFSKGDLGATCMLGEDEVVLKLNFECGKVFAMPEEGASGAGR